MATKRQLITVASPKNDVARTALIETQAAVTKCKEVIVEGVTNGFSQKEIAAKLNPMIAAHCREIRDPTLREQTRKSLVSSCKKWYYELYNTVAIRNRNLKKALGAGFEIAVAAMMKNNAIVSDIRPILTSGDNPGIPLIRDYRQNIRLAIRALAAESPILVDKNGRRIPLRLKAEMAARYEAQVQDVEFLRKRGVKLVWTSSHSNCSPRCKDFQGRLWSTDGTSGVINGVRYRPIEEATRGKLGDGNGIISGYNCRHTLSEYEPGSTAPRQFSEEEIKREYAIDQKMRRQEARIRQLKTEEALFRKNGDIKTAAALRKSWRKRQDLYKAYCYENGRAVESYRYVIDKAEIIEAATPTPKEREIALTEEAKRQTFFQKVLTNQDPSGTMIYSPGALHLTDKQFGKKAGKHLQDYGLDVTKAEDRELFKMISQFIVENAEEVKIGEWRSYDEEVLFHIYGDDVVLTKQDNTYITTMKGGVANVRVKNARKRET